MGCAYQVGAGAQLPAHAGSLVLLIWVCSWCSQWGQGPCSIVMVHDGDLLLKLPKTLIDGEHVVEHCRI